jgi:hypothetical protein
MRAFPPLPEWVALEHKVATILAKQEQHGWYFDERSAWQLASTLQQELQDIEEVLRKQHPYVAGNEFTPKRNNSTSGYIEGASFTRLKELNPTSRDHISWILQTHYGWKPTQKTATGKPIVDEVILTEIGSEISTMFARCLTVTKMLGMLSNGVNAWLKLSTKNRIHHFADVLLNGDIHQANADKVGVSRRQIKTITYAWCYGAGDEKIGHSYDPQLSSGKAKKKGKEIRKAFVDAIPGMSDLLQAIDVAAKRGSVRSIDGRVITLDSPHKALNFLLQSSAGVISRRWIAITHDNLNDLQICASQLAYIHDELQFESSPEHSEQLARVLELSAAEAGEYYSIRVPIAAESKVGANWSEVH